MSPEVVPIVLNWNNYKDTSECIESLRSSSYELNEILVVDNGSTDGSIEKIERDYANDPVVTTLRNEENYGFARGINVGIKYAIDAGAEYVFLLNNDTVVGEECIERLLESVRHRKQIGIAGPRILYHGTKRVWHGGGRFSRVKTGIVNEEQGEIDAELSDEDRFVDFITGCAMFTDTDVFDEVGMLDERYFFYVEDVDFCLRVKRAGFEILYVPGAEVGHKIGDIAAERTNSFVMYHLARSRMLFLSKNFSLPYFTYSLLVHLLVYTPYRALQIANGSRSVDAMTEWLRGTVRGLITVFSHD